jgi:hypothetical protein
LSVSAGKEHWLGLDNLFSLTQSKNYSMRMTVTTFDGVTGVAAYSLVKILNNVSLKMIQIEGFNIS